MELHEYTFLISGEGVVVKGECEFCISAGHGDMPSLITVERVGCR